MTEELSHQEGHSQGHFRMCLNSLPSLSRVRHWSCPEKLPSMSTDELLLLPEQSEDAESILATRSFSGLALWEEKVLSLRSRRTNKHRDLVEKKHEELRQQKEETVIAESLEQRLLRAFLEVDQEQGKKSDPVCNDDQELCCDISSHGLQQGESGLLLKPLQTDNTLTLSSTGSCRQSSSVNRNHDNDHHIPTTSELDAFCCGSSRQNDDDAGRLSPSPQSNVGGCDSDLIQEEDSSTTFSSSRTPCSSTTTTQKLLNQCPPLLQCHNSSLFSTNFVSLPSPPALPPFQIPRRDWWTSFSNRPSKPRRRRPPWLLIAASCVLLHCVPVLADNRTNKEEPICQDGVFRGNIDIDNREEDSKLSILTKYVNCSVVEGSISITSAVYRFEDLNYSLPNLIEVTDFLLLYRADEILSFRDMFPRLAVIRGHKLVQFYALTIFQNGQMADIGLPSLTHIMNGGVRIEKNPSLCYVDQIDWKKIVKKKDDHKNIYIGDNQDPNVCPAKCPDKCSKTENRCWNGDQCQRMLGTCSRESSSPGEKDRCYIDNDGQLGIPCAKECIGGCYGEKNGDKCYACNHTRHMEYNNNNVSFTCREKCPAGFVAYKEWTCIEERDCSNRTISALYATNSRDGGSNYKVEDDNCVEKCNHRNKAVLDYDGVWRCKPCEDKCPVVCYGVVVNSPETAKTLARCTDVTGDIVISVISAEITSILEENLQHIEIIQGNLKIERSHSLVSLHFFKSLREIRGEHNRIGGDKKVFTVFENDNLQKLFPENNRVKLGGNGISPIVFMHYNQKLCTKEINRFLDSSGIASDLRGDHMISPISNGNKMVCSEEKLKLEVKTGGPMLLQISYENYQFDLETNDGKVNINALLGYHIYYRELTDEQFEDQNMSSYDGMDVCGGSKWQYLFIEHSSSNTETLRVEDGYKCDKSKRERCFRDDSGNVVAKMKYVNITTYIPNCKPYTAYAVYVTTVIEKSLAPNATGAQSDIAYVRTTESPPSSVIGVSATSETNETTTNMVIEWYPPTMPNGIIEQYYVVLSYMPVNATEIAERDYCNDKEKVQKSLTKQEELEKTKKKEEKTPPPSNGTCPVCDSCSANPLLPKKQHEDNNKMAPDSAKVQGLEAFHNEVINKLFQIQTTAPFNGDVEQGNIAVDQRRRRRKRGISVENGDLNSVSTPAETTIEHVVEDKEPLPPPVLMVDNLNSLSKQRPTELNTTTIWMDVAGKKYINRTFVAVSGNTTTTRVSGLQHFGRYEINIYACQKLLTYENVNGTQEYRVCSAKAIYHKVTKHKVDVDNIQPFNTYSRDSLSIDTQNSSLEIRWRKPQNPNGVILHYQLNWGDSVDGPWSERCLSLSKITHLEDDIMKYNLDIQGEYVVRLRAISLFDSGQWTPIQWVKVASDNNNTSIIVGVVCSLIIVFILLGCWVFFVYRRQKEPASARWDYSSRNWNYVDTTYVADEWECNRGDIEIGQELGSGSFGMVYKGIYTKGDTVVHCAVKKVNEQADLKQRFDFLNEISAMKDCNTEHVIKLIGVVSQSQPVLVLMELMENGDLKEYLRKHRPDDQNNRDGRLAVPSLRQVLMMAADIADGMAYLGNKKLLHRDLAARNCMLTADAVVKVGDFGMARDVYETDYYRKEGRGVLPIRWMAPESIKDGKFTSQSDVWSFGVVLWEMATLAEVPYQGLSNEEVMSYVKDGKKMPRPENCPDVLYDMMSECWEFQPNARPTFLDICARLLPDASESFKRTAFYLTNEGKEAVMKQETMMQMRREQEEAQSTDPQTPLTGNGSNGLSPENGHVPVSDDSLGMVVIRSGTNRSPTHVQFNNEQGNSSRTSRLSMNMNGIMVGIHRLRNKSGSTSGEA